jgi:hypothetical protein
LTAEADALAALGLPELAQRLRAVATAGTAAEALAAVALATAACRLLRARLPTDGAPAGAWSPLAAQRKGKAGGAERLVPVGRLPLGQGEVWGCVRLRGSAADQWLLVEPLPLEERPGEAVTKGGMVGRFLRRDRAPTEPEGEAGGGAVAWPWLRRQVRGRQRWRARYPLGASGEVQVCTLEEPEWLPRPEPDDDSLARFRQSLSGGKIKDGRPS